MPENYFGDRHDDVFLPVRLHKIWHDLYGQNCSKVQLSGRLCVDGQRGDYDMSQSYRHESRTNKNRNLLLGLLLEFRFLR
jgi:hypothetical protein